MFRIHSQDDGKKIIKNKKYMTLVAALYYINGLTVEPHCGTCYRLYIYRLFMYKHVYSNILSLCCAWQFYIIGCVYPLIYVCLFFILNSRICNE